MSFLNKDFDICSPSLRSNRTTDPKLPSEDTLEKGRYHDG